MQIKDRTFIISGGSSGLGFATTLLLLSHGANVSILDLNPPLDTQTSANDRSRILFTKTDVSSTSSLQAAITATLQWTQATSKPLAGTVCCAGIGTAGLALPKQPASAKHDNVKYMDMSAFDRVLNINLRGTVDLIRLTLPHLALNKPWGSDGERGIVIVVSSVAAYEGQVGQLAYSASKGAVRSLVLPLARELGQKAGIRVMGIAPGVFESNMTNPKSPPAQNKKAAESTSSGTSSGQPQSSSSREKDGERTKTKQLGDATTKREKRGGGVGKMAGINPEMVQYPVRMGRGEEFARLVKEIVENPMFNGDVLRLDGGVRFPSRL